MYTIINDAFDYKFSDLLIKDWTHPSPLEYRLYTGAGLKTGLTQAH